MTRTPLVFLLVLLVFASWCRAADPATAGPIRLDVPLFEGGEGLDVYLQVAREYERARPHIKVDLYGDPRIADKIRIRILEKNFPEMTNATFGAWTLIRSGAMYPLDEMLDGPNWEGDGTWRDSFLPGTLDTFKHDGHVYAVPLGYYAQTIYYNKKMFRARGWRPPRTWDELFALCETIKSAGVPPLAFQGRYIDYAYPFVDGAYYQQAGAQRYWAMKRLEPGSFDNPEMVRALDWTQRLSTNYFQSGAMGMGHTEAQLQFFLGHTAMIPCGSWLKSEMTGKIPDGFELGTFNLPTVADPRGDPTAILSSSGFFGVFAAADHPREAADFLRFLTSRTMAAKFCIVRDMPVAVRGVNEQYLSSELSDLVTMIREARTTYGQAPGDSQALMAQEYADVFQTVLSGRAAPADAARQLEERAARVRQLIADPDSAPVRHVVKPLVLIGVLTAGVVYWLFTTFRRLRRRRAPVGDAGRPLRWPYVLAFVAPSLVLFLAFVIAPAAKSFAWSVQEWDGLTEMSFAGGRHFRHLLFVSDGFWIALRNNLFIMFVIPAFLIPLSLLLAACISRGVRGAAVFRAAFLIPSVMGGVAATLLWLHLYDPQAGIVNAGLVAAGRALAWLGLERLGATLTAFHGHAWLSQDNLYTALVPMSVWAGFGFNLVLYLAAMEAIPAELYEAAELDGATPWQQFAAITLPLIWEVLTISTVFLIIGGMKAFETIWLLTNQRPSTQVHVIGTRMVQAMFTEMNVGQATAIAVLLFVMVFAASAVALRVMRRDVVEM